MDVAALYTDVLDAGDRLVHALTHDDLDAVGRALDERTVLLDALASVADRPAPPQALTDRCRIQDGQIREALRDRLAVARDAMATVGRTASAHGRYHAGAAPAGQRLDTARRGPDFF